MGFVLVRIPNRKNMFRSFGHSWLLALETFTPQQRPPDTSEVVEH
jgi:hypothetical protein